MSRQPNSAKYWAMARLDTVMALTPVSANQVPTAPDWWVLKWGRKRAPAAWTRLAMSSMLRRARLSSTSRVGEVISSSRRNRLVWAR